MEEDIIALYKTITSKLAELRKEKGITQKTLANELGVSISTVRNYEKGASGYRTKILIKYVNFFGVKFDYIVGNVTGT